MTLAFFTTSAGDTELAIATLQRMIDLHPAHPYVFYPLSTLAKEKVTSAFSGNDAVDIDLSWAESKALPEDSEIQALNDALAKKKVQRAYIGVPSNLEESKAMILAEKLTVPKVVALEYLFLEPALPLWSKLTQLMQNNCEFVVPTNSAIDEIKTRAPEAQVTAIGHLAIDKALQKRANPVDPQKINLIRTQLISNSHESLKVISGTSVGLDIDKPFLEAILKELKSDKHSGLKVCFSLHPFVKEPGKYLSELLELCTQYKTLSSKFQIILPEGFISKLPQGMIDFKNPYLLLREISGPDAAQAADGVAQAVPGALVNESAILDKAAYCFQPVKTFLPSQMYAQSLSDFLIDAQADKATVDPRHLQVEGEDCPSRLAKKLSS